VYLFYAIKMMMMMMMMTMITIIWQSNVHIIKTSDTGFTNLIWTSYFLCCVLGCLVCFILCCSICYRPRFVVDVIVILLM